MAYKILAINPGSTSTKISLANDDQPIFMADITHTQEQLKTFKRISDQYHFRKQVVINELEKRNIPLDFDAVIGRGGLAKPRRPNSQRCAAPWLHVRSASRTADHPR